MHQLLIFINHFIICKMNPPYIERTGDVGGFDSHHRSSEQLETNHFQLFLLKVLLGGERWLPLMVSASCTFIIFWQLQVSTLGNGFQVLKIIRIIKTFNVITYALEWGKGNFAKNGRWWRTPMPIILNTQWKTNRDWFCYEYSLVVR